MSRKRLKYKVGTGELLYANGKVYRKEDGLKKRWEIVYGYLPDREVILIDNNPQAIEVMRKRFEGEPSIEWIEA